MSKQFKFFEFDAAPWLPRSWRVELIELAAQFAEKKMLIPSSVTSRELEQDMALPSLVVDGDCIKRQKPWLYDLYRGTFLEIGQTCVEETLSPATQALYGANLNIQRGTEMRYECHVDSNPLQGMLYVTDH